MRRVPILPSVIVGLAVALMIALGLWQLLDRLPRKEAYLAQLAANPARPPIAFPLRPDDRLLFRRTVADCRPPVTIRRAGAGAAGFRLIATCSVGQGSVGQGSVGQGSVGQGSVGQGSVGQGSLQVQLGTTHDPRKEIDWSGGPVTGYVSHAPDSRSLIQSAFDHRPQAMLLVADTPAAGLEPNASPDIDGVPNNHLAYAIQWFLFAAIAAIIYVLAVARRNRAVVTGRPPR
ncbi:SURF1 family cytochrome oxidase biogenesis protein [Sphingomonas sp. Leaf21]|uniref:SURF1 family cytochrome oxidase biogenesis protein n=1 Tax=Sphingomonas sp. Leaf21 TaxID=2876550 RepID=UPI001E4587D3|nr:SURF1 family cytochrome oxidase biogenesis protein [Sphingomonas sp. Leaf21]